MAQLTPKQQEIRDREQKILDLSRRMLTDGGYLGLNMDAIAVELEYSKGTIYNHFPCKEEIIIALAIETMEKRTEMFSRAAAWKGTTRQRLTAIGAAAEVFVKLYPGHFGVEQLIRSTSIWEKTSEKRRATMHASESRCIGTVAGVVRAGIANSDLTLPEEVSPEDLVFGLWSQTFGAYSIIAGSDSLSELGISDPFVAVRVSMNMTLDGYGWTPSSKECDYLSLFESLVTDELSEASASRQAV